MLKDLRGENIATGDTHIRGGIFKRGLFNNLVQQVNPVSLRPATDNAIGGNLWARDLLHRDTTELL